MKSLYQSLLLTLGAFALAGTANSQVPQGMWTGNDTSDGHSNTGMGIGALGGPAATNGGHANTASGYNALASNTVGGDENTAAGWGALYSNTTGGYNTASGFGSLYTNSSGNNNTATGYQALYNNRQQRYRRRISDSL
jgi:hypothetical protein